MEKQIDYTAMGERIRCYREQKRMTQEQLGEACNLSTGYIGHIERGSRKPSLETLYQIAQTLSVSTDALLFDKSDSNMELFNSLQLALQDKEQEKVKTFLHTVCALADKIDEL